MILCNANCNLFKFRQNITETKSVERQENLLILQLTFGGLKGFKGGSSMPNCFLAGNLTTTAPSSCSFCFETNGNKDKSKVPESSLLFR